MKGYLRADNGLAVFALIFTVPVWTWNGRAKFSEK